ncbi:MAG: hypothetical protein KF862_04115 [Chitinophagaceae bacterium]|nr:hypothetical protein [Chitinophagaceae bacterium]
MNTTDQKKEEWVRGYHRTSKAWYATEKDKYEPRIEFGFYHRDGDPGTIGEMSIRWKYLDDKLVPYLHAFDDSWKALSTFTDLLKEMVQWNNKNITEDQFAQLLNKTGFTDLTRYRQNLKPGKQLRTIISSKNKGLKK